MGISSKEAVETRKREIDLEPAPAAIKKQVVSVGKKDGGDIKQKAVVASNHAKEIEIKKPGKVDDSKEAADGKSEDKDKVTKKAVDKSTSKSDTKKREEDKKQHKSDEKPQDIDTAKDIIASAKLRTELLRGIKSARPPFPVPTAEGGRRSESADAAALMSIRRRRNRPDFDPKVKECLDRAFGDAWFITKRTRNVITKKKKKNVVKKPDGKKTAAAAVKEPTKSTKPDTKSTESPDATIKTDAKSKTDTNSKADTSTADKKEQEPEGKKLPPKTPKPTAKPAPTRPASPPPSRPPASRKNSVSSVQPPRSKGSRKYIIFKFIFY